MNDTGIEQRPAVRRAARAAAARICLMTETYYPIVGGGETQARALSQDLVRAGYPVTLVTRRSERQFARHEQLDGANLYRLSPSGPGHLKKWAMLVTATFFLFRYRRTYDIILVSGYRVLGIAAVISARLLGKRCILKADNNGEMSGEYFTQGIRNLHLQWAGHLIGAAVAARNALFRRCDRFVALSTDIRHELQLHKVDASAIVTIPNGYDPERFNPARDEHERLQLRRRLGLNETGQLVVFTGRLLRSKGLPLLVSVWRKVAAAHPDTTLVIVGSGRGLMGSCEDEIRAAVAQQALVGRVLFAGSVSNVEDYLRSSDVFVFPTEDEAFGISLIEAMACGLPCIATTVGGIKDIVRHGMTGILVAPGDAEALCEALHTMLGDPDRAAIMGQRAAGVARERYARQSVAQQYMNLFDSLME